MKSFQSLRQFYQISGIMPPQSNQKKSLLNGKNLFFIISTILVMVMTTLFSFFKTATLIDYGKSSYTAITIMIFTPNFVINIYKSADIFKLIEKFDKFIEKSELFPHFFKKYLFALKINYENFVCEKFRTIGFYVAKC